MESLSRPAERRYCGARRASIRSESESATSETSPRPSPTPFMPGAGNLSMVEGQRIAAACVGRREAFARAPRPGVRPRRDSCYWRCRLLRRQTVIRRGRGNDHYGCFRDGRRRQDAYISISKAFRIKVGPSLFCASRPQRESVSVRWARGRLSAWHDRKSANSTQDKQPAKHNGAEIRAVAEPDKSCKIYKVRGAQFSLRSPRGNP